jgi:murein DD-endopeptidase MepM/ murein hydrolase activator NlpD
MKTLISIFSLAVSAQLNMPFVPVYPVDVSVSGKNVNFLWEILEEGYEYKLEILYQGINTGRCYSVIISAPWITENNRSVSFSLTQKRCWRLKYRKIGETEYNTSEVYRFSFIYTGEDDPVDEEIENETNQEEVIIPEESPNIIDTPDIPEEDIDNKEDTTEEIYKEEAKTVEKEQENYTTKKDDDDDGDILGTEVKEVKEGKERKEISKTEIADICRITYNKKDGIYTMQNCSFSTPEIKEVGRYEVDENYDYILIKGTLVKQIDAELTVVDCESFSVFKPATWFKCSITKTTENVLITLIYSPSIGIKDKECSISAFNIEEDSSFLLKIFSEKLNKEKIYLTFNIYFYIKWDNNWLDFKDTITTELTYTNNYSTAGEKDLEYIFKNIIGVTQWHGFTAYTSPHTGIDFGAVKQPILSPADGTIYDIGWDDYYGECNSGGKYIKIKHDNGMYTVYMHLDSYTKDNGTEWKVGERIKEGEQIGISGNTGAYNCQTLGYHLHYELRKNSKQSSHTNPVPYTDIDWDLIPTINWHTYPGRLTGDNPHPNF